MKYVYTLFLSLLFFLPFLPCRADDNWDETARKVLSAAGQMDERSLSSKRFINQDKNALKAKVAALKKRIAENTRALEKETQKLNKISAHRARLADHYQREAADMKTVEGSFRTALGHTLSRFDHSPVAAMHPEKKAVLKSLLKLESFPGPEQIQEYTDLLFSDIRETGTMEKKPTRIIDNDGLVREVNLTRAGGFFLGYQDAEQACFVLPDSGGPGVSIKAGNAAGRSLTAWLAGKSDELPLDITGGAAVRAVQQAPGMEAWVEAGGVLLYPILLSGLIGALLTILKALDLLSMKRLGPKLKQQVFNGAESSDRIREILSTIKRCPAARVVETALSYKGSTVEGLDNLIEEKIMAEQGKQERFLSIIGVLASIAPLLGLLGTVTGMIDTFQAITVFGTGDPRMMSTGISEALVTTQAGLGIAIPLLLAHHFLKRRVARLVDNMEACGMGAAARLSSG